MKKVNTLKLTLGVLVALGLIVASFSFNAGSVKATDKIYNVSIYTYDTTAAFNWYTDASYLGEINYGETLNYGHKITKNVITDWHSYELTSLNPGSKYFYELIAKNKKGEVVSSYQGEIETTGVKPATIVYKPFFYLNFNSGNLYSFNNQYPLEILNPDGIKSVEPSVWQGALNITKNDSHVTYSCTPLFNAGYGTINAWVRLEKFDKDMTIWETNDGRFSLYFQHGSNNVHKLIARAGYDSKAKDTGEAVYIFSSSQASTNVWLAGEWHQIAMVWEGKIGGTLKLYIDGEARATANYTNAGGCTSFMVGNNYVHTQNFSNGQIDDFKMYDWNLDSTSLRNEYRYIALNQKKDVIKGQIAGAQVRNIKMGKLIKLAHDPKVYLVGRDMTKIYVANEAALERLGNSNRLVIVTAEELAQYTNNGTFYSWSKYPDASLLKGSANTVYWVWNGEKRAIANETVFHNYNNDWSDVINISNDELNTYPTGSTYH